MPWHSTEVMSRSARSARAARTVARYWAMAELPHHATENARRSPKSSVAANGSPASAATGAAPDLPSTLT